MPLQQAGTPSTSIACSALNFLRWGLSTYNALSCKQGDSPHVMEVPGEWAVFEVTEKHATGKHVCSVQPTISPYPRDWAAELSQCFITKMPLLHHSFSTVMDNSVKKTFVFRGLIISIFMLALSAKLLQCCGNIKEFRNLKWGNSEKIGRVACQERFILLQMVRVNGSYKCVWMAKDDFIGLLNNSPVASQAVTEAITFLI